MSDIAENKKLGIDVDTIDLKSLLFILIQFKWVIITFVGIGITIGMLYAFLKAPMYRASVILQVNTKQQGASNNFSVLTQQLGMNAPTGNDGVMTQSALIRSRFILNPVIHSLGLDLEIQSERKHRMHLFESKQNYTVDIKKLTVSQNRINKPITLIKESENRFKLLDQNNELIVVGVINQLIKSPDNQLTLLIDKIDAPIGWKFKIIKHADEEIVKKLLRNIKVEEMSGMNSASNMGPNKTGLLEVFYSDPDKYKAVKIVNAIAKILQSKNIRDKILETENTLTFLTYQLPLMKLDLTEAETKLNKYRSKTGKIDIRLETQHYLIQLADIDRQIRRFKLMQIQMLQNYTALHPYLINLKNKINAMQTLQDELMTQLKALPKSDQTITELMRDVKVKNSIYLLLLNKIQELRINKAGIISDIRILSFAEIPYRSLPQGIVFIILTGFLIGFIIACIIVLIVKALFRSVEDPTWIEKNLNLLNVATIPYSEQQEMNLYTKTKNNLKQIPLLAHECPQELSIETLRSLRTTIQVILLNAKNNIISIMGIGPAIGKSFISANLAYLMADTGKKVLLIDADIRRGYLKEYFNSNCSPGLVEAISGKNAISECLLQTQYTHLTFLPTGDFPKNPSELLTSAQCKELLVSLTTQFDYILIDTAPVLAVTDGVIIGNIAGTNLLVVGSGKYSTQEIEQAMGIIGNGGVKLHGYIFNQLKPEIKIYGKSQYYNYHTYAGETG